MLFFSGWACEWPLWIQLRIPCPSVGSIGFFLALIIPIIQSHIMVLHSACASPLCSKFFSFIIRTVRDLISIACLWVLLFWPLSLCMVEFDGDWGWAKAIFLVHLHLWHCNQNHAETQLWEDRKCWFWWPVFIQWTMQLIHINWTVIMAVGSSSFWEMNNLNQQKP